jgi:hypothetical protein
MCLHERENYFEKNVLNFAWAVAYGFTAGNRFCANTLVKSDGLAKAGPGGAYATRSDV